jgi:hypothetical protein
MNAVTSIKNLRTRFGAINCTIEGAQDIFFRFKRGAGLTNTFVEKIKYIEDCRTIDLNNIGYYDNYKSYFFYHKGWTFFLQNIVTGTDRTFLANFSFVGGVRSVLVDCRYGDQIARSDNEFVFEYYEGKIFPKRTLCLSKQTGKWKFFQKGDPFEFEDQKRYGLANIQSRLDEKYIKFLLDNLGVELDSFDKAEHCIVIETLKRSDSQ